MVQLLRYQIFLLIGSAFIQFWIWSLNNSDYIKQTISSISTTQQIISSNTIDILIKYMPIHAIILLGIYALTSVLYKVATFGDCSTAGVELSNEILVAKEKLKSAGFTF